MPQTPDRRPGRLEEDEEILLAPNASPPSGLGAFNFDGSNFVMRDALGDFNPRDAGGLPTPTMEGQILFSHDGVMFRRELPVTSEAGWLVNDLGILVAVG